MGHSKTIGRPAKMGWKKKKDRDRGRDRCRRSGATDPILSTQRMPRGRDPVFIYTKNAARRYEFHPHKECLLREIVNYQGYI